MMATRQATLTICLPTIIMNGSAINQQTHNNTSHIALLTDRTVYYYNSSEPYSYAPASMWWISGLQPSQAHPIPNITHTSQLNKTLTPLWNYLSGKEDFTDRNTNATSRYDLFSEFIAEMMLTWTS